MEKINVSRIRGLNYEIELPERRIRIVTDDAALIDDCLDLKQQRRPKNYEDPIEVVVGIHNANKGVSAPDSIETIGVFTDPALRRWFEKNVFPMFEDVDQGCDLFSIQQLEDWIKDDVKVPIEFWEFIAGLKAQKITYIRCISKE